MKASHRYNSTRLADADLLEIWKYIADHNLSAATRLTDDLVDVCEMLAGNRLLGEVFDPDRPFLRRFSRGNYVIYYRTSTEPITVLRVLHGARDVSQLV
jgi:toxin ParE1/3/4